VSLFYQRAQVGSKAGQPETPPPIHHRRKAYFL